MTTGVVAVRADTPYREMAAMVREHRVSGFPVVDDAGKVIGVVSETDLLAVAAADPDPGTIRRREAGGRTASSSRSARPPRAT